MGQPQRTEGVEWVEWVEGTMAHNTSPAVAAKFRTSIIRMICRRLTSEPRVSTLPDAMRRIHKKSGTLATVAGNIGVTTSTLHHLESGFTKYGSPSLLSSLSLEAHKLGLMATAEWLADQALIMQSEVGRRGGRR